MNVQAAREMGVHVGSVIQVPFYTDHESTTPSYNGPPFLFPKITVVGEVVINSTVIQDDIDELGSSIVLLSPQLTKQLATCCSYYSGMALQCSESAIELGWRKRRLSAVPVEEV